MKIAGVGELGRTGKSTGGSLLDSHTIGCHGKEPGVTGRREFIVFWHRKEVVILPGALGAVRRKRISLGVQLLGLVHRMVPVSSRCNMVAPCGHVLGWMYPELEFTL